MEIPLTTPLLARPHVNRTHYVDSSGLAGGGIHDATKYVSYRYPPMLLFQIIGASGGGVGDDGGRFGEGILLAGIVAWLVVLCSD